MIFFNYLCPTVRLCLVIQEMMTRAPIGGPYSFCAGSPASGKIRENSWICGFQTMAFAAALTWNLNFTEYWFIIQTLQKWPARRTGEVFRSCQVLVPGCQFCWGIDPPCYIWVTFCNSPVICCFFLDFFVLSISFAESGSLFFVRLVSVLPHTPAFLFYIHSNRYKKTNTYKKQLINITTWINIKNYRNELVWKNICWIISWKYVSLCKSDT